jgi:Tfp pilus assembly protein PilF
MKSLMVKVAMPIILIFMFTHASAQHNQTESRDAEFYFNRGRAYANKGQYDQAISDCTKALEIEPRYAEAYIVRGVAYSRKGQHDQAISDYTKAYGGEYLK